MFPVVKLKGSSQSKDFSSESGTDVVIVPFAKSSSFKSIESRNFIAISIKD